MSIYKFHYTKDIFSLQTEVNLLNVIFKKNIFSDKAQIHEKLLVNDNREFSSHFNVRFMTSNSKWNSMSHIVDYHESEIRVDCVICESM